MAGLPACVQPLNRGARGAPRGSSLIGPMNPRPGEGVSLVAGRGAPGRTRIAPLLAAAGAGAVLLTLAVAALYRQRYRVACATLDPLAEGSDAMSTLAPLDAILEHLTAQQQEIARSRPLPEPTLRSLLDDFTIRYAHHTTAIEGNTLTLEETHVVLEHGMTVGGKTVREHLEVLNVRAAWERLMGAVQPDTPLTEELVLDVHKVLMKGIIGDDAGRYRRMPVYIRGSMDVPPNWLKVPDLMADFARTFRARPGEEHPIRFAARAHVDLVGIHPFVDGNGRVARMLANFMLMRDGWPPVLYTVADRADYLPRSGPRGWTRTWSRWCASPPRPPGL